MKPEFGRREFVTGMAAVGALSLAGGILRADLVSPFQIAVITDEITQDFGRACEVIGKDFGMRYVELRELWGKNLFDLDAKQLQEAKNILDKYGLGVADIASPLFKVDWPGAPKSKFSPTGDKFNASFTFDQQGDVLSRAIKLAKLFKCPRVRCFDFWRLDDPKPYRKEINKKLLDAANELGKNGLILVLENEPSCNTATGKESGAVLTDIQSPYFFLNWDPGNAAYHGESPFPEGYSHIPSGRIGHCHAKDVRRSNGAQGYEWAAMGSGEIDWVGQFRALKTDGYRHGVSLETHWRGAGSPEDSTRESWKGMRSELAKAGIL